MRICLLPGAPNAIRFPIKRKVCPTLEHMRDIVSDVRELLRPPWVGNAHRSTGCPPNVCKRRSSSTKLDVPVCDRSFVMIRRLSRIDKPIAAAACMVARDLTEDARPFDPKRRDCCRACAPCSVGRAVLVRELPITLTIHGCYDVIRRIGHGIPASAIADFKQSAIDIGPILDMMGRSPAANPTTIPGASAVASPSRISVG